MKFGSHSIFYYLHLCILTTLLWMVDLVEYKLFIIQKTPGDYNERTRMEENKKKFVLKTELQTIPSFVD